MFFHQPCEVNVLVITNHVDFQETTTNPHLLVPFWSLLSHCRILIALTSTVCVCVRLCASVCVCVCMCAGVCVCARALWGWVMNPHFEGNAGKSATIVSDIALIVPQGAALAPSTRPSSNQYQFPLADHSPFTGHFVSCFLGPWARSAKLLLKSLAHRFYL